MDNTTIEAPSLTAMDILNDAVDKLAEVKTPADILRQALVKSTDQIAPPDYLIKCNDAPICSLGDFSLITGKAKSRKTLLISLFVAVMLKPESMGGMSAFDYPGKTRILWFDTEQSRYHSQRALIRAVKAAGPEGKDLGQLELYCLRPFSPQERVDLINEAIVNQNAGKDIAFVIIDGIRDLITDINSPEQATDIATKLMKWTEGGHLHIMTLLHQNKGDSNARGHVGTELVNKAQTVISVEVAKGNKDVSNVNPEQTREQPFEPFSISFDADGLPFMGEVAQEEKPEGKRSIEPHSFEITVHEALCVSVFENQEEYSYPEIVREVRLAFDKMGRPIGDSKAKLMVSHWVNHGLIKNEGTKGTKGRYKRIKP